MIYNSNWCNLFHRTDYIDIEINASVEDVKKVLDVSVDKIARDATEAIVKVVGENPVICLSGGIDSQATVGLWHKDFPATVVTFEFANGLNQDEIADAKRFAEYKNFDLKIITLDVLRFLHADLKDFASSYNISSPQFAVHARFLKEIKKLGYTGAVFGGNGLVLESDQIRFYQTSAQLFDLEKYSRLELFPVVPSFLSFHKDLCLKLASETPIIYDTDIAIPENRPADKEPTSSARYTNKVISYENLDLQIVPQECKKTGFEEIKNYYNNLHGSCWAFEKDFRLPLYRQSPNLGTKTIIDPEVVKYLLSLQV